MQILDAGAVVLSPGQRLVRPAGDAGGARVLTVAQGSAWVRGAARVWTPLLAGRSVCWSDGEQQEVWSPEGMSATVVDGPAAAVLGEQLADEARRAAAAQSAAAETEGLRMGRLGRSAVRILCVNDADKVLLWRWPERVTGGFGWLPVGGGIEPDEDPVEAARREWSEETGLDPDCVTGHHVFVHRDLRWEGARHVADEAFFLAETEGEPLPEPGRMLAGECRWTPIEEIGRITEQFEPPRMAAILAALRPAAATPTR